MSELMKVLINRDGLSVSEAEELISNARQMVLEGDDPEEVGNHVICFGDEKYCDNCVSELSEPTPINPYSEEYVNNDY